MRITIILAILLSTGLLAPHCFPALAQTPSTELAQNDLMDITDPGAVEIGDSLISPVSPLYFLKSVREKIEKSLVGTDDVKLLRELEFSQRRLRETNSLVKSRNQDLIPPTIEKYKNHIQNLDKWTSSNTKWQMELGQALARHLDVLMRLYDNVGDPRAKQAILSAIILAEEYNSNLVEKLDLVNQQHLISKIALRYVYSCNFLTRESASSSLNDTERLLIKEKALRCQQITQQNLKDELMELQKKQSQSMEDNLENNKENSPSAPLRVNPSSR